MPLDPYRRLARHLDELPGGFPPTDSGVELRILRRLFTEEEAELAVHLTVIPEPARVVARRAGLAPDQTASLLEEMARKGLVFRTRVGGEPHYLAAQFVVGIWEYHVEDLDEELIRDVNEYLPAVFDPEVWRKAPQLRTIPVGKSLQVRHRALPYEQAERLVRGRKRVLVAPCICRREHRMVGQGCDRPEEACLVFDWAAEYYRERGVGRVIDEEEALALLAEAEKQGLVVQPSNSQRAINICLCCGCCCQVLLALKRTPRPADYVSSAFVARLDGEPCNGCGLCARRCPMEAVAVADGAARLDPTRCIGCGLCASRCPTGALQLERRPAPPEVPPDFRTTLYRLGRARGKMSPSGMAWTLLRSKLDRLLARP
ncbi:MAG: 4Fe-4S binding protein [Deferrisomatales bacterium]